MTKENLDKFAPDFTYKRSKNISKHFLSILWALLLGVALACSGSGTCNNSPQTLSSAHHREHRACVSPEEPQSQSGHSHHLSFWQSRRIQGSCYSRTDRPGFSGIIISPWLFELNAGRTCPRSEMSFTMLGRKGKSTCSFKNSQGLENNFRVTEWFDMLSKTSSETVFPSTLMRMIPSVDVLSCYSHWEIQLT